MTREKLEQTIFSADKAMAALLAVRSRAPEGSYITGGFVRNLVWDSYYTPRPDWPELDVDVVYFNPEAADKSKDKALEKTLAKACPGRDWQVRNQAYMHHFGGHPPFKSMLHALTHWAETATTVSVRLCPDDTLEFITPFGFDDLFDHILRITPIMKANDPAGFEARLAKKGWQQRWPKMQVIR